MVTKLLKSEAILSDKKATSIINIFFLPELLFCSRKLTFNMGIFTFFREYNLFGIVVM